MFQAEQLEILVLVENWVDMLLPDQHDHELGHCINRFGLVEHFDPKQIPPIAENGISLLVRAYSGRHMVTVLFDVGLTGTVLAHNLNALNENVDAVDHVVISHAHPDHFGGIHELLSLMRRPVPINTHPDAFLPRYAAMADGRVSGFYNHAFQPGELDRGGGRVVLAKEAIHLGCGISTTGEIPRNIAFEGPRPSNGHGAPGLYQIAANGAVVTDEVWDEQGLVVDVKNKGLVVVTGCAHAGVVNTIHQARRVCGEKPVLAVLGGFHLGFPTTPIENVGRTVQSFQDLDVGMVIPMHCSGLRAHAAVAAAMPDRYVQPAVGTRLRFGS